MPTDCDPCDCPCILANISYYSAAMTVDAAALAVAQAQYNSTQSSYYYWLYNNYSCGCGAMMATADDPAVKPNPVTLEMMKSLMDSTNATYEAMKKMSADNYELRKQIRVLTPE